LPWFATFGVLTEGLQKEGYGMGQLEGSREGKHLTMKERIVIERMSRGGIPLGASQRFLNVTLAPLRESFDVGYNLAAISVSLRGSLVCFIFSHICGI